MIILLLFVAPVRAATYYMRADGTAANKRAATSCSSASTAMSVATHNSSTFSADDIISLCDTGGDYKASIIAPSSGTSGHPIIYNNANGATPVIDLSVNVGSSGWTTLGGGVYRKKGYGRVLWEDDVPLKAASNASCRDGNWYYNTGSGVFQYKPTSGTPSDHTIRTFWFDANWAPYGLDLRNKSNVTVHGLTFNRCSSGIGHGQNISSPVSPITNIAIHDNTITRTFWAIWSQVVSGVESDISIYNNTIDYCNSGISAWTNSDTTPGHTEYHTRYSITGNHITNLYSITSTKVWSDTLLTSYYYTDHEGISFQDVKDSVISDNTITTTFVKSFTSDEYWTRAIYFYLTNGATATSGNSVLRNYISGHFYPAIYVSTAAGFAGFQNNTYAYNVIRYDQSISDHISFDINMASDNPLTGTNYFVNNTIYNSTAGLAMYFYNRASGTWVVRNNIVRSPSFISVSAASTKGLTFDHNIYVNAVWGFQIGTNGMTFTSWKSNGHDTIGSRTSDPRFVSASDLHLQAGSPAIGAGVSVGQTKDITGHGVPVDSAPDIGAYEYVKPTRPGAPKNLRIQ